MIETFVPMDFVFGGIGLNQQGKKLVNIFVLDGNGAILDRFTLPWKRQYQKVTGQVYRGAEFSAHQVKGLADAKIVRRWEVEADRLLWLANDLEVDLKIKLAVQEKDAKSNNELLQIMLPLRQLREKLHQQRDVAGINALEYAVTHALKTRPKVDEK